MRRIAYACVTLHFAKREYETLFVHRFSHATMPLQNLFKNCGHYWILSGVLLAYFLYAPVPAAAPLRGAVLARVLGCLAAFLVLAGSGRVLSAWRR